MTKQRIPVQNFPCVIISKYSLSGVPPGMPTSPQNTSLNKRAHSSSLLLFLYLTNWNFCSCRIIVFSSHIRFIVTTSTQAAGHDMPSIEQNTHFSCEKRYLLPKIKRYWHKIFSPTLFFDKMLVRKYRCFTSVLSGYIITYEITIKVILK